MCMIILKTPTIFFCLDIIYLIETRTEWAYIRNSRIGMEEFIEFQIFF